MQEAWFGGMDGPFRAPAGWKEDKKIPVSLAKNME
jgi:hypothetical protein